VAKAITHRASDLTYYYDAVAGPDKLAISTDDVIVSVSQCYFAYGFNNQFVYPMFSGCHVVLRPQRRRPEDVLETVRRYRPTLLFSVPSALAGLVRPADLPAAELRAIVSAGEPLPAGLDDRLCQDWGVPVLEQIGCTEVGNAFCANGFQSFSPRSTGQLCAGYQVEIRPSDAPEVVALAESDANGIGDVWVAGPTIPRHAMTARGPVEVLTDGWLRTNDYGYWNSTDGLVVLGRRDDILLVGGICVSAIRIEHEILTTGQVLDAAVSGIVDTSGKSALLAYVVPKPTPAADLADTVLDHLRNRLERYEIPKSVLIVSEIPRTPSGKLQRYLLEGIGQ
jgi:acyl-coenzyme A synthetase/AMP-(fatty) acid ligase